MMKKSDENFFNNDFEDMIDEKVKEEPKEEVRYSSPISKKEFKVIRILGNDFILADDKGNGIKLPIPPQYANAKRGDVIYL